MQQLDGLADRIEELTAAPVSMPPEAVLLWYVCWKMQDSTW